MTIRLIRLAATASFLSMVAGAAPAFAQDDSLYSGWYIGGNLGVTSGNSKFAVSVAPGSGSSTIPAQDVTLINASSLNDSNKTGFTGGVEGGYNWQSGSWLFGIEAEWVALNVNERVTANFQSAITQPITPPPPPVVYSFSQRAKTSWMWTVRPRIGYVSGPWLFYGTAGAAGADLKSQLEFTDNRVPPNAVSAHNTSSKTGYAAGLGAAYAFSPTMSLKGEWLYAGFGTVRSTATSSNGFVAVTSKATIDTNIFRAGLDWRF
jgi:outer membrane immunogenic protein